MARASRAPAAAGHPGSATRAALVLAGGLLGLWGGAQAQTQPLFGEPLAVRSGLSAASLDEAIRLVGAQQRGGRITAARLECRPGGACVYLVSLQAGDGSSQVHQVDAPAEAPPAAQTRAGVPAPVAAAPAQAGPGSRLHWGVYAGTGTGQIAGLGNVILRPVAQLGLSAQLSDARLPHWEVDGNARVIHGRTTSTDPVTLAVKTSRPGLQEYRAQGHLIYNFDQDGEVAKAGVGLYLDLARALHDLPRYSPPEANAAYAAEEGEIVRTMVDTGLDFRFRLRQQRVASELHNVIFINGSRIAPNLLTYKPMLGFMWSNQFAITGSIDHPGWTFGTEVDFYFARKAGVAYFNLHDGIGGTKREIDLSYGVGYHFDPASSVAFRFYGNNNLNRGNSSSVPVGFKDGLSITLAHQFQ